jgi:hypothetical protein
MTKIENECCGCATESYPCLGSACPNRNVKHYYCDKCNDNYLAFMKEYDKNYCHKTSKWMSENVSMECYEPTETTQLLDGMVSDLKTLLENIKNNR